MNPATALARVLIDELRRCGLREAVLAPGSRSAPLAMALHAASLRPGGPRLHVRADERSAAFLALGLGKAGGRPALVVCTSGTAAAHFHAAVIEADEACVPLLVLTADRPPELRGTGASQVIDQLRLYGPAVRWFCEAGVPEAGGTGPAGAGYWRSMVCRAWALAAGTAGGPPGPVHVNLALRDPLVPDGGEDDGWDLAGRAGGEPWTRFGGACPPGLEPPARAGPGSPGAAGQADRALELPHAERGVIVCGDGAAAGGLGAQLAALGEAAGWPVLAEPSSGARRGPAALTAYSCLLAVPEFLAGRRPDMIVSAGRPGLSRGQLAFLRGTVPGWAGPAPRHVVVAGAGGRWSDPARTATDVAAGIRVTGTPAKAREWLSEWQAADAAARQAAAGMLDGEDELSEPAVAREVAALLPDGALLWAASSLPVRDLDQQAAPRAELFVTANRGASGIDGLVSSAMGAALAHQAAGGGPAAALLGDLALLHDSAGLFLGPGEPRPDLCLVVVNNDGGGIFSQLEQAAFAGPFERVFGTPTGARIGQLAAAAGIPYARVSTRAELAAVLEESGLRLAEVRTDRAAGAALRASLSQACAAAVRAALARAGA